MDEYRGGWKIIGTIHDAVIRDPVGPAWAEGRVNLLADLVFTDQGVLAIPKGTREQETLAPNEPGGRRFILIRGKGFKGGASSRLSIPPATITPEAGMLSPAQTSLAYDHIPYTEIIEVRLEELPRGIVERFLASFFSRHIGSEHFTRVRLRTASEARISWASQRLSRPFGLSTGKMRAFLRWFPPTRWNFSRAIWYLGLPAAEVREFLQRTPLWLKLIRRRP